MKKTFHLKIFLAILLYAQIVKAQEVSYRHIGINEGLPSSEVYCVIQDSKGYIWTSTDAGVCRFNGRKFTCFTIADGLKDNTVFNLFEDRKGRIWMICYNGAVCYYENGKIAAIPASDSLVKILKNGSRYIFSSALGNGDTLWLGTIQALFKIPPNDNYGHVIKENSFSDSAFFAIKTFENSKAAVSSCYSATEKSTHVEKSNISFLIQCKGKYNFIKRVHLTLSHAYDHNMRCLYLKDGTLLFSHTTNLYTCSPGKPIYKKTFASSIIFLSEDKSRNLWIGFSKEGIYKYPGGNLNSSPIKYFTDKSVSGVVIDHEGGVWFSTLESGIYYAPMNNYRTYQNNSFFNEKICGLDALDNKVFVATNKSRIFIINSNNTIDQVTSENEEHASRSTEFINYNGKIFIVGNIVGNINIPQKTISYFTSDIGRKCTGIALVSLNEDNTYLMLDGSNIRKIEHAIERPITTTPARSACMIKTNDGIIHIGTRNGLYKYLDEKFIPEFSRNSLFRSSVICMKQDNKGRLLLGTKENGLIITKDGKTKAIGSSQGLSSDICTAILPDTNETIWVGSNKGISLLKINNNDSVSIITTLNTSHGLSSNEITRLARRGNILYVGTKEGLCEIDISLPFYNSTPPPVLISSVYVNKNPIDEGNTRFEYNQNNFRFYIDCLSYKDMFSPSFYYRLRGYDSTLQLSSAEFIDFSNLPPGNYQLEVFGLNNNKVLSVTPALYRFSIATPFWIRWWFILAEVLAGTGIVFCFIRIRLKDIRKKEEEKTKINRMIAESQMTALRSQMNPHFIFNSINSIQNYILKQNTQQAYDYLAKFSKLIRLVLNNSKENMLTLEQELQTLSIYVELEQMRFDSSFDFSLTIDKNIDKSNYVIPGMLLQPFIENAIWHGIMPLEEIRRGKVMLHIKADLQSLIISIEDNGIGREKSKLINKSATHRSIGMLLSQNRLAILNQSNKDRPYDIVVEDLYNDEKQPTGTRVILTIPILLQDEN